MNNNKIEKYIYANQVRVGSGDHDAFIDFFNGTAQNDMIDGMRVNMSLPFAKRLVEILSKSINNQEGNK